MKNTFINRFKKSQLEKFWDEFSFRDFGFTEQPEVY